MQVSVPQQAYLDRDVELSKKFHTESAEDAVLTGKYEPHLEKHQTGADHLKSAVYGGMDGIITTYSIIMGVVGANLPIGTIVTMGVANIIADSISMSLGDYLSSKSEKEFYVKEREREKWEVENNPEGEKIEMIELYQSKGIEREDAIIIADTLSKNNDSWVDIMMVEELGLLFDDTNPLMGALITWLSFNLFGLLPLLPYIVGMIAGSEDGLILASTLLTIAAMFTIGVCKSIFSCQHWWYCGFEALGVGAAAASVSYLVGLCFEDVSI